MGNIMRYGLLWAATGIAAGILAFSEFSLSWGILAVLYGLCWGILLAAWRLKQVTAVVCICAVLTFLTGYARMGLEQRVWEKQAHCLSGSEGIYQVVLKENPSCSVYKSGDMRGLAELEKITYPDGESRDIHGSVYIYFPETQGPGLLPGDRWYVKGALRPVRLYRNPGKINLAGRYQSKRLLGKIYVENPEEMKAGGVSGKYGVLRQAEIWKGRLRACFYRAMDKDHGPIMMTLLFGGSYDELPEGVIQSFSDTGIVHILSVSGSHISLVLSFLTLAGRWVRLPERIIILLSITGVLGYSVMAGWVPPVIRAVIMGILSAGGLLFNRDKDALNLLGAAVLCMLLWNPLLLYDVSFQLSAGASLGILLFYRPAAGQLKRISWLPRFIAEGIALSVSAQLITIPLVLYNFHRLPSYFILSNLWVTPFLEWAMLLGLGASFSLFTCLPLTGICLQAADFFVGLAVKSNYIIAGLPGASFPVRAMTWMEIGLYYWVLLLLVFHDYWKVRRRAAYGALGVSLFLLLGILAETWYRPSMVAYVLDVSPARAAVIRSGESTVVYVKNASIALPLVSRETDSFLQYLGVKKIDLLLWDDTESREWSPVQLSVPIMNVSAASGENCQITDPVLRRIYGVNKNRSRWRTDEGLYVMGTGPSWIVSHGKGCLVIDGGKLPGGRRGEHPGHCAWIGGAGRFKGTVTHGKIKRLQPEVAVYTGNKGQQAGEEMALFHHLDCPVKDTRDGMAVLSYREHWELE